MKRCCQVLAAILFFAPFACAQVQPVFGTWYSSRYKVTMTLRNNGTYAFLGPQGMTQGRWGLQGNIFWMSDQNGQTIQYRVRAYTGNSLLLLDARGMPLNYTRKNAATPRPAVQKKPSYDGKTGATQKASKPVSKSPGKEKVIARANGHKLTEAMIQTGIDLIQFVSGHKLDAAEKAGYRKAAVMEFKKAPAQYEREALSIARSVRKMKSLTDPAQIGAIRQQFVSTFYKATAAMPEYQKPAVMRLIFRHCKVLAYDKANNLALTRADAQAAVNYLEFCDQCYCNLLGKRSTVTPQLRQWVYNNFVQGFAVMPLKQKQFLVSANAIWQWLQANWQKLGPYQRGQLQGKLASAFPTPQAAGAQQGGSSYSSSYALSSPRGKRKKSLAEMQRDFNARQACFRIMNNMSLQHHATMLNTIENFGGTGNYWKVVDTPY